MPGVSGWAINFFDSRLSGYGQVEASTLAEQNVLASVGSGLHGVAQGPSTLIDNRIVFWWDLDLPST
jgi:hypothetical protein